MALHGQGAAAQGLVYAEFPLGGQVKIALTTSRFAGAQCTSRRTPDGLVYSCQKYLARPMGQGFTATEWNIYFTTDDDGKIGSGRNAWSCRAVNSVLGALILKKLS